MAETMAPDDVARLIEETVYANYTACALIRAMKHTYRKLFGQGRRLTRTELEKLRDVIAQFPEERLERILSNYPEAVRELRERIAAGQSGKGINHDHPSVH
jgi:hypothetical protein